MCMRLRKIFAHGTCTYRREAAQRKLVSLHRSCKAKAQNDPVVALGNGRKLRHGSVIARLHYCAIASPSKHLRRHSSDFPLEEAFPFRQNTNWWCQSPNYTWLGETQRIVRLNLGRKKPPRGLTLTPLPTRAKSSTC